MADKLETLVRLLEPDLFPCECGSDNVAVTVEPVSGKDRVVCVCGSCGSAYSPTPRAFH